MGTVGLLATGAGAQTGPTLSVSPAVIEVGQSATISATECVAEGIDQSELFVVFQYTSAASTGSDPHATDGTGTASLDTGAAPPSAAGLVINVTARCVQIVGETETDVFTYDQKLTLSVVGGSGPTSPGTIPTSIPSIPEGPAVNAAGAVSVTPTFTG